MKILKTYDILRKFRNLGYSMFESCGILWKFQKLILLYGGFKTHGILWKFLNPRYLTEVLKDFSWDLKKSQETHSPGMI